MLRRPQHVDLRVTARYRRGIELFEFFGSLLEGFNPKRTVGKVVWGVLVVLLLVVAVMWALGDCGY